MRIWWGTKLNAFSSIVIVVCFLLAFLQPSGASQRTIVDCGTLYTQAASKCIRNAYDDPTHWALFCTSDGAVFCCHVQDNGANSCSRVQGRTTGPAGPTPPTNVGVLPPPSPPPRYGGGNRPPNSGGTEQPPGGTGTGGVGVKPVRPPPATGGNQQAPSGGTNTIYVRSGKH
jgi:hypothetical protein